jgi:hypothetical protein
MASAKSISDSAENRIVMIEPYWRRGRSRKGRNPCQIRSALFIMKSRGKVNINRPDAA